MVMQSPVRPVVAAGESGQHPAGQSWLLVMTLRAAEQQVLVVVGQADLATADQLRNHLLEALSGRPPAVLVELGALEFCDLSGLDALHDAATVAREAGVSMTFRGMSPQLSWLHRTFPAPRRPPSPRPGGTLASAERGHAR